MNSICEQLLRHGWSIGLAAVVALPAATTESPRTWPGYRTILWMGESVHKSGKLPLVIERLEEMGINTVMVYGDGDPKPWIDLRMPYYVENIVNRGLCLKFHSKVTDWDRFVTEWARAGRPESALVRDYSLDDPEWRRWAREQMQVVAQKNAPHGPLAYNIRDELSTTISANPFDYDFSEITLGAFRQWLRSQYADLAALNAKWQTHSSSWEEVRPFTTDQVKQRMAFGDVAPGAKPDWARVAAIRFSLADARKEPARWNFAPWADFRTYMDLSLARVLDDLRQVSRRIDPATPVGIEGTQMPHAFGGYDLWRLSQVLDWVEPYDIGNAREIFGSFMTGKTILTTVFETETDATSRRLWHLLLEGDRGCIIWWSEDCIDWKSPDLRLTRKAEALKPVLREMTGPPATLVLEAKRQTDAVFIHYSQASIQADWLIESAQDGSTWPRRFSSFEASHNRQAKVRNSWLKLFQDLGFTPRFISSEQIESGLLRRVERGVLVLPASWALSEKEGGEIQAFAERAGGECRVFFDGTPGVFDARVRLVANSALEQYFARTTLPDRSVVTLGDASSMHPGDIANYAVLRLKNEPGARAWRQWASKNLGSLKPRVMVDPGACVRVHRMDHALGQLVAFERNIDYQMSEDLKQAGGNEPLEEAVQVIASLHEGRFVYDLRARKPLGRRREISFTLDPWRPSLFLLSDREDALSLWRP